MADQLPFGVDFFSNFFSPTFAKSSMEPCASVQAPGALLSALPCSYSSLNAVFLDQNLAVIPGEWQSGNTTSWLYDIVPADTSISSSLQKIKSADFIGYDGSFFETIGPDAKLEKIQSFPPALKHVHEAPVYLPDTNELLYSDTSLLGTTYAIEIDTHKVRNITTDPPLWNVNGGTLHRGKVYLVTNGSPVRGIHTIDTNTGKTKAILNNFRGRHFNSPNDLIFDSKGSILFTDPTYGQDSAWPGVQASELPMAIYRFNPSTGAVTAISNNVVQKPNGLALSADEKTLYVADSLSTSNVLSAQRAVWAFDYAKTGPLTNPRLVYQVESGWPDGLRVTKSGLLLSAVYGGVDIVYPDTGVVLGKINCPDDIIYNLEPARAKKGVWLLTGRENLYKVTMKEQALPLAG
ncbi:Gluconolactonase [Pseudocercospora fuligena]|uniref:Gluconolactonase n=1 Tax=Pseudocercospora fuligena TaxID=685502 RepID=A0A8H6RNV0_9PEZI|nr:Gluconolactonase [Pseudocercospora fuligena]